MPVINWQKLNNEKMKKKILTGLGALIFLAALILNVSIAKDNNNLVLNKMGSIAVAQDENIGEGSGSSGTDNKFTFNGQSWNTTDTHTFGSQWKPVKNTCTITETSGSYTVGVSVGVVATYTTPTTTVTYSGNYIACVVGNGNCWNGTDCIKS
jgi:hypothetical protein